MIAPLMGKAGCLPLHRTQLFPTSPEKRSGYSRWRFLDQPPVPILKGFPHQAGVPLAKYLQDGVFKRRDYYMSSKTELRLHLAPPLATDRKKTNKGKGFPFPRVPSTERRGEGRGKEALSPRLGPFLSRPLLEFKKRGCGEGKGGE